MCESNSRGPGLFAPVIGEISSTNLTPASGRQDHTTSPSALAPSSAAPSASIAFRPASVTIAIRPPSGRNAIDKEVIWVWRESKYFCGQDWTSSISLIRFDNSSAARKRFGRWVATLVQSEARWLPPGATTIGGPRRQ